MHCFAFRGTATACIRTQLHPAHPCKRCTPPCGLHLRSNAFAQQRNSQHPHSAAFAALHCQVPHTSPEGLRLHSIAAPPEHTQQSAFAPSCTTRFGLHSQSAAAQHLPCTALQPWRASFVQQVLSPAWARQQAASAAGCLLCSKSASAFSCICRSFLPSAAHKP